MSFPERVQLEAKRRSAFRCCICQRLFVEVHHIPPRSEGGKNTLDNAAPLCASCHDLFGGNPEKRKQIRQMRDAWWDVVEQRRNQIIQGEDLDDVAILEEMPQNNHQLKERGVAIYHCVFAEETFEEVAQSLYNLIKHTQENWPNQRRLLYLDIEGHRNDHSGFDWDMFELQRYFILGFLLPFLSEIYIPLVAVRNTKLQRNDIGEEFFLLSESDVSNLSSALSERGRSKIYLADIDRWMTVE